MSVVTERWSRGDALWYSDKETDTESVLLVAIGYDSSYMHL